MRHVLLFAIASTLSVTVPHSSPAEESTSAVKKPPTFVYSKIQVPGARSTVGRDINKYGDIVGNYTDAAGVVRGFLLEGGSYTAAGGTTAPIPSITGGTFLQIDYPGSIVTRVNGNNDRGDVVGSYQVAGETRTHAFLLRCGVFSNIDLPGATTNTTNDINNRGAIAFEATVGGKTSSYVLQDGVYTDVSPPASFAGGTVTFSFAAGINKHGTIVGRVDDTSHPGRPRGFRRDSDGVYTDVFFPGAIQSAASGISDKNDIVGGYMVTGIRRGYYLHNSVYTSLDVPGCVGTPIAGVVVCTVPWKVNKARQVVGLYGIGGLANAGFLAQDSRRHGDHDDDDGDDDDARDSWCGGGHGHHDDSEDGKDHDGPNEDDLGHDAH